jgi:hypothetical protein
VNIRIANANEAAKPASSIHDGNGKIIMQITPIKSSASRIVGGKLSTFFKFFPRIFQWLRRC